MSFTKTQSSRDIISVLAEKYAAEKIILFGSHARGNATARSDIDFVVIKKTRAPFLKRMREVATILKTAKISQPVDVLVYTPEEFAALSKRWNPFFHRVARDGKIVYAK